MADASHQINMAEPSIVFTAVYEWSVSKSVEILLSVFNILMVTPWMAFVIWFERFGSSHRRTLINQLVASMFYYAVFYGWIGQAMDIIIASFGPFGPGLCHLQKFIRGVMVLQLVQLQTFIITVKYFYIFILKNPYGVKEEFWCLFVNVWTLFLSCIAQFVNQFMPGRNQINVYICLGSFETSLAKAKVKPNYVLAAILTLSLLWYSFASVRIFRYKRSIKNVTLTLTNYQDTKTKLALMVKDTFKLSLVNLAMLAFGFLNLFVSVAIPAYLSTLEPASFNQSPIYQLYHFSNHGFMLLTYATSIFIYYYRNLALRQAVLREIRDQLVDLREKFFS